MYKLFVVFCSSSLAEMVGELFLPHDMPEPPKESFFKGLFGGGARSLDREELCKYITLNSFFCKLEIILLSGSIQPRVIHPLPNAKDVFCHIFFHVSASDEVRYLAPP